MCGIAGLLNLQKDGRNHRADVENMLATIRHRGPDDSQIYHNKNITLGLNRLSILDLSEKGAQPMSSEDRVIVFNGLIYNYIELKKELENHGYKFKSRTDTEIILASFDKWGAECVERFNGMWAFIIYDKSEHNLFISRDRYGIKPLYIFHAPGQLCFSSEIKAFESLPSWKPKSNPNRIYDFLKYGLKNHTSETMFEYVHSIPPGSNRIIDCHTGEQESTSYYSLDFESNPDISFDEACETFSGLFNDALKIRLRSDVPVGMALSGGLDSSAIALGLHYGDKELKMDAICSSSKHPKFDESSFASSVSNKVGFQLHNSGFDKADIKKLSDIIYTQDEPFPGASVIAQNLVFKKANSLDLKVMFSGQGADEYLMGYDAFLPLYFLNKNPILHPFAFLNFIWKHRKTVWKYNILRRKATDPPLDIYIDPNKIYAPASVCDLKERSHQYFTETVLPALLHFEDRNSMAYGIESRLPFLDYRIVEFCFSLPEHFFIKAGVRKRLLRQSFKEIFPPKIYHRYDKSAFGNPLNEWIKTDRSYFTKLLDSDLDLKGVRDPGLLWRMIGYNLWKKRFNVA